MAFDPPSRAAGQCSQLPELVQFLKDKNLDGQLDKLLEMSETDLPQKASEFGLGDEDVEQLGKLVRQERDRRAKEPSVGGRLAEALKNSGAQFHGNKVHVPKKLLPGPPPLLSGEHRWAMRVYEVEFPPEFVEQKPDKDKIILLLGDRTSKQDLINLMLNYNVGMKLQEPQLEISVDQGTEVHSSIAAFKIPAILGGQVESGLTIINAPDFDNDGMEDRIAGQVKQFLRLTKDPYTISGVCCLVRESKRTPENYKRAFKAVLTELDQDIAERTMLCIMSGESSDADGEKLKDVWQPITDAGILYKNWSHFKWPLLLRRAATSHARKYNSDYLDQFFRSLSRKSKQTGPSKQKDGTIDARKKLLDILEKNPDAAQTDLDAENEIRDTLQYAPEAAKRMVVIGGTGVGKSAFCGLVDGSLNKNQNVKGKYAWSANCTLGHEAGSETNVPKLIVADWCGKDSEFPIIIVDTPGMGDTRSEQKDTEHLRTIAGWVNGLREIHLVVILVDPGFRMSGSLRKMLLEFQNRFGQNLWAHAMVVVNRWDFYADDEDILREEFEQTFRKGLQDPIASGSSPLPGQTNNTHHGLGLTEEDCSKMLPFAFMKVQYLPSDPTKVVEAMKAELDKMKATLKELEPWRVRVKAQSESLNDLINAVRNSNDSATLKQVFHSVNSRVDKPTDLTQEKLDAVEEEIVRREDLEAAEESLTKAVEAFTSFKAEGTSEHAETFVSKLDMAMKKLPDALMNPRISRLKPFWDMLKVGLEGKEDLCKDLCKDLPIELQQKVNQLLKEVRGKEIIENLLAAWNIKLSKEQLNQLYTLGVSSDEDLAQHISQAGTTSFPAAARPRAMILKKWNGLKDSSVDNLKWTDANNLVKKLEELIRGSKTAQVPRDQIQKMQDKKEKAEAEEKRERKFTTMRVDMDWRPFGSLASEHTRLSLQNAPEAFIPAEEILIQFKDRPQLVKVRGRQMEHMDGVQLYVLDLQCESRIPSGDLNATLVTSEENTVFQGEMTVPGEPTFRLPFDDKHWYCIKPFGGGFMNVPKGTARVNIGFIHYENPWHHNSQFRFVDTSEGKREFKIYLRHQDNRLVTNHSDYDWHLVQHWEAQPEDQNKNWQIWTVEKADSFYYLIKSKKDGKVIFASQGVVFFGALGDFYSFTVRSRSGDNVEKFTFQQMDPI